MRARFWPLSGGWIRHAHTPTQRKRRKMIAVRLHKMKNPYLRRGSYLIPISAWEAEGVSGAQSVRHWRSILHFRRRAARPNTVIRYITLVRIPDDFPVAVFFDWCVKQLAPQDIEFRPLHVWMRDFPTIKRGASLDRRSALNDHGWSTPELILGAPLPKNAILWTKDIQKLYGRKRKQPPGEGSKRNRAQDDD